jgi:hypothetical protein
MDAVQLIESFCQTTENIIQCLHLFELFEQTKYGGRMPDTESSLSHAVRLLRRAAVRIAGGDLQALALTLPDGSAKTVSLLAPAFSPTPSKIEADLARHPKTAIMYVVVSPGLAVMAAAENGDVDLISVDPPTVLIGGDRLLDLETGDTNFGVRHRKGKTPWGQLAAERALIVNADPMKQSEIADVALVTQQAVSNALKSLDDLVVRLSWGWKAKDAGRLIDRWLETYPGPGGATTYWYSLDSPGEQAKAAVELARELDSSPLVSGDAAADLISPWRLPITTRLYIRQMVDFTDAGFTPTEPQDATLIVTVPDDPTLWTTAGLGKSREIPVADPLIVLWDVLRSSGPDADEAAARLRETIEANVGAGEGPLNAARDRR